MSKSIKYAFRMTHIENIPHILQVGIVHKDSPNASPTYIAIGDQSLILARNQKIIAGRTISEYIPFYFGPRSPMLYRIQTGYGVTKRHPQEIVYCVLILEKIIASTLQYIFTDGHANSAITSIYTSADLSQIDVHISYDDIYARQWSTDSDIDLKRRKEAELLFIDEIPVDYISGYIVYNEVAKQKLLQYGLPDYKVIIKPEFYY